MWDMLFGHQLDVYKRQVRINNAVGLRYNFAINATGNMLVGCTVIFYSLFHNQNKMCIRDSSLYSFTINLLLSVMTTCLVSCFLLSGCNGQKQIDSETAVSYTHLGQRKTIHTFSDTFERKICWRWLFKIMDTSISQCCTSAGIEATDSRWGRTS